VSVTISRFVPCALAAATLLVAPAQAQQDTRQYRVLNYTSQAGILVSADVAGPRNARRFREVMVLKERFHTGADAYVGEYLVDCGAGTIVLEQAAAYQGDTLLHAVDPGEPKPAVPQAGTISADMVGYACTGALPTSNPKVVTGLPAAFALGREIQQQ
jgi:hypothetical protein